MVGKPNLPSDAPDEALDQERGLSMADEGGAAGAAVEAQAGPPIRPRTTSRWLFACGAACLASGVAMIVASRRRG